MARRISVDPAHTPPTPLRLRLREAAQAQDLTIAEVARRSGLTRGLVERYWLHPPRTINLDAINLLAQALEMPWHTLLTTTPEDTDRP